MMFYVVSVRGEIDLVDVCELLLFMSKLFLYVFNVDEVGFSDDVFKILLRELVVFVDVIFFDVKVEVELVELDFEDVVELFVGIG